MKKITVELKDKEEKVLKELAEQKGMSEEAVMKQALRTYQLVEHRIENGERIYAPNEKRSPRVQFGPDSVPQEKINECFEGFFDKKEEKEDRWDNPEFVYTKLSGVREQSRPGFVVDWGIKGIGFGQIILFTKEGKLILDHECTDKKFAKQVLGSLIDSAEER